MKPFSLFFLSILLLIQATKSHNLINSTCKSSAQSDPNINYNFCVTSLQAAPASQCATLRGLVTISIRLIRYNITDTRCHIKQLLNNKNWDPYTKQSLSDCLELYSDAIPSVRQAMKDYNARRFNEANVQISAIMDDSTTCEDGFEERRGVVSPLRKRNNDAFQLSAMALSVMHLIQTGSG